MAGSASLPPGETLEHRLLAIELRAEQEPSQRDWPQRCTGFESSVRETARDLADADALYRHVASDAEAAFPLDDVKTGVLRNLFDDAAAVGLSSVPVSLPPPNRASVAPAPLFGLPPDVLTIVAEGDVLGATTTASASGPVRLLWPTSPRRSCRIDPSLHVAHCADLSPAIGGDDALLRLASMADDVVDPAVQVDWNTVLRGSTGAVLGSVDGMARADGSFLPAPPARPKTRNAVVGDQLLTLGDMPGDSSSVSVRAIADAPEADTPLGSIPSTGGRLRGCRAGESFAVAAVGKPRVNVAFFHHGSWSSFVSAPWSGAPEVTSMTCTAESATFTTLADGVVSQ
ncbi:MAG TPA: hypothetical protein VIY73_02690, partial [Polyangiaceae bacterium]